MNFSSHAELIIIGAGPIGIELAANCKRLGLDYLHFEAGVLANTIYHWPRNTPFFSSPERVGIAGIPVHSTHQGMISGDDYLVYLRTVVETYDLEIHLGYRVLSAWRLAHVPSYARSAGFEVTVEYRGRQHSLRSRYLVLATGNMHQERRLGIPGEDSEHVDHYYADVHKYFKKHALIVGGRNSAVEAAIRMWRSGVRVTLLHREPALNKEKLNSRYSLEVHILIRKGRIDVIPNAELSRIEVDEVEYTNTLTSEVRRLAVDNVILCTGFEKDLSLLHSLGVALNEDLIPQYDSETMETNVPGLFLAGTAASGGAASYKIFVGTSHRHVQGIVQAITGKPAIIGDLPSRVYPFSVEDLEPIEGKQ